MARDAPPASPWRRLGWFVLLYGASLVGFATFVYGFRAFIPR